MWKDKERGIYEGRKDESRKYKRGKDNKTKKDDDMRKYNRENERGKYERKRDHDMRINKRQKDKRRKDNEKWKDDGVKGTVTLARVMKAISKKDDVLTHSMKKSLGTASSLAPVMKMMIS